MPDRFTRSIGWVAAFLLGLAACGGSGDAGLFGDTTTTTTTVVAQQGTPSLAGLLTPPGWSVSADGSIIAELAEDVANILPVGPRILITRTASPDLDAVQAAADRIEAVEVVEDPRAITVLGSRPAVTIVMRETEADGVFVRRYVAINEPGLGIMVTLEVPDAGYPEAGPVFETILGLRPAPDPLAETTTTTATTTTTIVATTTSTQAPPPEPTEEEITALAAAYVTLIATGEVADSNTAAQTSTGLASAYADFLAISSRPAYLMRQDPPRVLRCLEDDPDACFSYENFTVEDGVLSGFDIDGIPIASRLWVAEDATGEFCLASAGQPCDRSVLGDFHIGLLYGFIQSSGQRLLAFDVATGDSDLVIPGDAPGVASTALIVDSEDIGYSAFDTVSVGLDATDTDGGLSIEPGKSGVLLFIFDGVMPIPTNTILEVTLQVVSGGEPLSPTFILSDLP